MTGWGVSHNIQTVDGRNTANHHLGWLPSSKLTYPNQGTFEDDVPFPKVGYVSFLEGTAPPPGII